MTQKEIIDIEQENTGFINLYRLKYMIVIFSYGYWVKSSMKKHQIFVRGFTLLFDGNMRYMHAEGL